MIDRFDEFVTMLGEGGAVVKNEPGPYRHSLINLAQLVNDVRKQSRSANVESDQFGVMCKNALSQLAQHNRLALSIGSGFDRSIIVRVKTMRKSKNKRQRQSNWASRVHQRWHQSHRQELLGQVQEAADAAAKVFEAIQAKGINSTGY